MVSLINYTLSNHFLLDASALPFPIAANAMAVVYLSKISVLLRDLTYIELSQEAEKLSLEIRQAIATKGVFTHPIYGQVYAYEIDGFGNAIFMDDANVPSLLSLPFLGFCSKDDPIYLNTRKLILSLDNPYYFKGSSGKGIGSPHTGLGWIWPMSIVMQAITSTSDDEIKECLEMLKESSKGFGFLHESVCLFV